MGRLSAATVFVVGFFFLQDTSASSSDKVKSSVFFMVVFIKSVNSTAKVNNLADRTWANYYS